jgi:radical SAM superfamily enzyme YgiQ (UPF0313 family)
MGSVGTLSEVYQDKTCPADFLNRPVTLIRPPILFSNKSYSTPVTLPIGLAYIAAVLEKLNYETFVIDAIGLDMDRIVDSDCNRYKIQGASFEHILDLIPESSDIIGVSIMFSQEWPFIRKLIKKIKQSYPNKIIVIGGEHATALTEYTLKDCPEINYIIKGEGEIAFLDFCHAYRIGSSVEAIPGVAFLNSNQDLVVTASNRLKAIDHIPWPLWEKFNLTPYFRPNFTMAIAHGRNMPLLATRGCPYQCTFCSSPTMWTTRYTMRPPSDVVDEIVHNIEKYGANSIDFYDLTAIVQKKWIMEFTEELKRRNVKITWSLPSGTRSEALDEEVLRNLKETGMELLVYAPESASTRVLHDIKKKISFPKMFNSIVIAKKYGLIIKLNYVMGFPTEKRIDMYQTLLSIWRFALIGVEDVDLSIFSPYPGSELFEQLKDKGKITAINDKYFEDLLIMYDMTETKNFCPHIFPLELNFYRFLGMSLFYILSYLSHPQKILRVIKSFFSKTTFVASSVFEQRLFDILARSRISKELKRIKL